MCQGFFDALYSGFIIRVILWEMALSGRPLVAVTDVNHFKYATQVTGSPGEAVSFFFRIMDSASYTQYDGLLSPEQNRYLPATGATATVEVLNLDNSKQFTRNATNPFGIDDRSIWVVNFLASDPILGTASLKVRLKEGALIRSFVLTAVLLLDSNPDSLGGC